MNYVLKAVLLTLTAVLLFACSKSNDKASIIDPRTGKHLTEWAVADTGGAHPAAFITAPGDCNECHGKDLSGGISKVSCFSASRSGITCHAGGPSGHPAGFRFPEHHGQRAKAAAGGVNGMAFCKNCHGSDFRGAGSAQKDCIGCHQLTNPSTLAPHSPQPWRGGTTIHTNTDQSNAAACAQCHTGGANLRAEFKLPSYAGGTPGCFNNTLCHGVVGHKDDARQPWADPANHGASAKGDPSDGDGLSLCKTCHGQALTGRGLAVSCFSCHATAPHSPQPWRRTISITTGRIHTDTNPQNAVACFGCHTNNQRLTTPVAVTGTPGCFDNSMCHGVTGHNDTTQFPLPAQAWKTPVNHGVKAKGSTAVGASGFTYCRNCHGNGSNLFKGGTALTSCMNVIGCHITLVNNDAPHPSGPWRGTTAAGSTGHPATDTSNAGICAICHTNGANSTRAPQPLDVAGNTGCFNTSLCHGITGHTDTGVYPPPWTDPANHGSFARSEPSLGGTKGLAYCQHCHGTAFSGGGANKSCYPCHGVSAPHPDKSKWTLAAGTLSHVNAGLGNAGICYVCHNPTIRNLSEPYLTRFASSPAGSFSVTDNSGCFNASMCHGDVRETSNCGACHSTASTNPFKSMAGSTDATDAVVGAHTRHLNAASQTSSVTAISANIACSECHSAPTTPAISDSHRNGATEISFGALAKTGSLNPTISRDLATSALACSNTYCHGASLTGGSNKTPRWNDTLYSSTGTCNVCHGYPPATASGIHTGKSPFDCIVCHQHVNPGGSGFDLPSLHIDGKVDFNIVPNHPTVFPGATHRAIVVDFSSCGFCHDLATTPIIPTGSGYPVAAGSPPKCAGCHLAGVTVDCSDCHGDATGRPNGVPGVPFPNRAGTHNNFVHPFSACIDCHPFTDTSPSHGWSNRIKSTAAQVRILSAAEINSGVRGITRWNDPAPGQCTASCHIDPSLVRPW